VPTKYAPACRDFLEIIGEKGILHRINGEISVGEIAVVRRLSNEEIQRRILEAQQRRRQSPAADEMSDGATFFFQGDEKHDQASEPDLSSIINVEEIQSIMKDFHSLTGMVTAILDLRGNIIQSAGWQDICTKFHRIHPATLANCAESDQFQMIRLEEGEYFDYRCRNGLWDVVTPLYIQGRHLGNIYTGQFFYDDDVVDEDFFMGQAESCGFDREEYLAALRRVPRRSRESVDSLMSFLVKFTGYISGISYMNLKLEKEILERRMIQETLSDRETLLQTLIGTLPDLVWLKDQNGYYLFCNSRFEDFFGHRIKEIVGKTDYDFVERSLADFFRMKDRQAIQAGRPVRNEEEITFASDGHREVLETVKTPMFRKDGQLVGVLGVGRDITERRRAEEERERLMSAIEQSSETIVITDAAGTILYANPAFERITGYSRDEAVGRNPRILKSGRHDENFYREMWDVLSAGKTWQGQIVNRRKDGNVFTEAATISPVFDFSGSIVNYVAVKRDITENIRSEEEKDRLEDQYRQAQKVESIGRLAGGVATT
jgi:PAS domain S-box-containing protein